MWFLVMWFLAKRLSKPWRTRKRIIIADHMLRWRFWTAESSSLNLKVCLCEAFSVLSKWVLNIRFSSHYCLSRSRFYKAVLLTDSKIYAAKKNEKKRERASSSSSSSSSDSESSSESSSDSEESDKESKKQKKRAKKQKKKQKKKKDTKRYLIYVLHCLQCKRHLVSFIWAIMFSQVRAWKCWRERTRRVGYIYCTSRRNPTDPWESIPHEEKPAGCPEAKRGDWEGSAK